MAGSEYFGTGPKKGRGRAKASIEMMHVIREIAEPIQPVTGRGIGYKLFSRGLIPSMDKNVMKTVYQRILAAREDGIIPWNWIVDEAREIERAGTWDNPEQFARVWANAYRKDFWQQQPIRCMVVSEKGTVRGVVAPVLDEYGVDFLVTHGFAGATTIYDIANDNDGRPLG